MKKIGFLLVMLSLGTLAGCAQEEDTTTTDPAPAADAGMDDTAPVADADAADAAPAADVE
jgi:hypothetical protein